MLYKIDGKIYEIAKANTFVSKIVLININVCDTTKAIIT